MGRIRASRPSSAMIVAVLALGAALTGTAVAEVATTAKLDKKEKRQVKRIARKQINKLASGLSVASAETANRANTANTANSANSANTANTANSANTANQAQNAGTANGVKPVKVDVAASGATPPTTFVDQGGARVTGECTAIPNAVLTVTSTANDGIAKLVSVNVSSPTAAVEDESDPDLDSGESVSVTTSVFPNNHKTVTLTYRSADGTVVTGDLMLFRGAMSASCVIGGTLFVG